MTRFYIEDQYIYMHVSIEDVALIIVGSVAGEKRRQKELEELHLA